MKISPLALMVSVFGLAVFSLYKIEGIPKLHQDKIKSQHAVQDYDTIKMSISRFKRTLS